LVKHVLNNSISSELLGHANVQITLNTYVHPSMEQKRRQLEQMAIILGRNLGQEKPKTIDTQRFERSITSFNMKRVNESDLEGSAITSVKPAVSRDTGICPLSN